MIKFFRKIRQKLLTENKFSKYLIYAIGEIILVVIGILIALQINNWNNVRHDRKQEKSYLIDIKTNLLSDKNSANQSLSWNIGKIAVIDSLMQLLNTATSSTDYMEYLVNKATTLGAFTTFDPVSTAFDNMTESDNISIVQNNELRNQLTEYYSYDWEKSPQTVTRNNTRNYARIISSKIIGDTTYHRKFVEVYQSKINEDMTLKWYKNFSKEFQDPNYIEFHSDREAVAAMFIMLPNTLYHSGWIEERAVKNIDRLLIMIDKELSIN
jgi:hypothetical protein